MILSIGATGLVGLATVQHLRAEGAAVRALTRPTAAPEKRAALAAAGAAIVEGDLKDGSSIQAALRGVKTVISSASVTLSRQDGDSIQSVDLDAQLALVDASRDIGVEHFVFVSFAPLSVDCALQRAKRAVEQRIRDRFDSYAILQPVNFNEVWLSPAVGFDPTGGQATVWGTGRERVNWISAKDVAWYTANAALRPAAVRKQVLQLGGPEALSPLEVISVFEQMGCARVAVEHVSVQELQRRLAAATDEISEAFAALMLNTANGWVADASLAHRILPHEFVSVRKYAREVVDSTRRAL